MKSDLYNRIIEDGNFKRWVRSGLIVVGFLTMFLSHKFVPPSLLGVVLISMGLGIAAIGGYASRTHMLGIKPFDNSYKKARDSYKSTDDEGKKE